MEKEIETGMDVETRRQMAQFLTTEHFNLQGAHGATVAEVNSQTSTFLSIVSAGMVALALVAQVTQMSNVFFMFALVLFPVEIVIGVSTFTRLVRMMITDAVYTLAMNRIRQFYIQAAPDTNRFLTLSSHDDAQGVDRTRVDVFGYWWEIFASNAGQVAVINSFLCAIFCGLLVYYFIHLVAVVDVIVGLMVFGLLVYGQIRFFLKTDLKVQNSIEVRFPTPDK